MHQLFFMMKMKMMPSHHDNNTVYDVGDVDDWDDQNAIRAVNWMSFIRVALNTISKVILNQQFHETL